MDITRASSSLRLIDEYPPEAFDWAYWKTEFKKRQELAEFIQSKKEEQKGLLPERAGIPF